MSKCRRCGVYTPVSPVSLALSVLNFWLMTVFLEHVTPMPGDWLGAKDFWITTHWIMWWLSAVLAALGGLLFTTVVVGAVLDPDGYRAYREGRR